MAHSTRILPDSSYANGLALPATAPNFLQALDAAQAAAINGDTGGVFSTTEPTAIGGAGVVVGGSTAELSLSGGALVSTVDGNPVLLGADDVPTLGPGHSAIAHSVVTTLGRVFDVSGGGGLFSVATPIATNVGGSGSRFLTELRVHDGAQLVGVVVWLQVGSAHVSIPTQLPMARVYSVDASGNVSSLFTVGGSNAITGGGYVPTEQAGSVGIWNGLYTNITGFVTPTVPIDRSTYVYVLEVVDEAGAGALPGNVFMWAEAVMGGIGDTRFQ